VRRADIIGKIPKGESKPMSIAKAKELYPSISLRRSARCSTDSDGLSDALLIAESPLDSLSMPADRVAVSRERGQSRVLTQLKNLKSSVYGKTTAN